MRNQTPSKMYGINEVTYEHIESLDERQLVRLMEKLIELEVKDYNIQDATIIVPQNTKSKDGGSDGRLQWTGGPKSTSRFKSRYTVLQSKAADLFPSKCAEEMLPKPKKGQPKKLKAQVEDVVDKKGSYILFNSRALTDQGIKDRIKGFRAALKEANKPNHSTFNIEVFDANYLARWVNQHASAVNMVRQFNGVTIPEGLRNWETLNRDIAADTTPFQSNEATLANIQAVQNSINTDKAIRISGHSGLGKTRFIHECFRPVDSLSKALNQDFLYYDLGASGEEHRLINFVMSHRENQSGILVVDNCDSESHIKLSQLVRAQGGFKVITIGYDASNAIEDSKIKLLRSNQRDLVRKIIEQKLSSSHSAREMDYIERLSEGYPWMAVRFCNLIAKTGIRDFDKELDETFIKKLVFGSRTPDETEYEILKACSVFSAFGFIDDSFSRVVNDKFKASLQDQMDFIRTKVCDVQITSAKFNQTCQKFLDEDIIERRGTHYIVKPTVLAIQLAAQWLRYTPTDKIKQIIQELSGVGLQEKFMQRLTDLDQLDKAKEIVEEFWGPNSPFGSAEVLSTAWGSLLFRYVVEVSPESTCAALEKAIASWNKDQLKALIKPRRNMVWALEKLCFRKETFLAATKMLFRLAVSENESWANNATSQISQLFHRFLAGTEVDYDQRLQVLEWALKQKDDEYAKIAINCMLGTFIPHGHHVRTVGAEDQGGGASLVDYFPPTWKHVYDYWQHIIDLLLAIANAGGEKGQQAIRALSRAVRTMASEGATEMIINAIEHITFRSSEAWMEVRAELKKALRYEQPYLTDIQTGKINKILEEYQPKDLNEEFLAQVTKPDWEHEPPIARNGQSIYPQQLQAEAFAKKLVESGTDWSKQIPSLLVGEQRQGFTFGYEIGKLDPKAREIARTSLHALGEIEKRDQNPGFLFGLASGIADAKFFIELFDTLIKDAGLSHLALQLTRQYEFPIEKLMELFILVDEYGHPITELDYFKYGKPLQYLNQKDFYALLDRIAAHIPEGPATAFSILFMQCFQNTDNYKRYEKKLKELITGTNLLLSRSHGFESFYWAETVSKLLSGNNDKKFATIIAKQLAEFSDYTNFSYAYDHDASSIFDLLIREYFKESWPAIGKKMTSDYLTLQHLKSMIGAKNGSNSREGFLFTYPENFQAIYDWAEQNEKGRIMIANILPFYSLVEIEEADTGEKKKEAIIHPFTQGFLDRFAAEESVLDELGANIGTFGTTGGSEPYFNMLEHLCQSLVNHKIPELREWAKKAVAYYKKSVIIEGLENQDRFLD